MAKGRQPVGPDGLTIKQARWLKVYVDTRNATEAAMQAYDCKDRETAAHLGWENVRKLQAHLPDLMDAMGLTLDRIMRVVNEGLDADRVEVAKFEGQIGGEKAYPDYPTRRGYADMAAKLRGAYPAERHQIDGNLTVALTELIAEANGVTGSGDAE